MLLFSVVYKVGSILNQTRKNEARFFFSSLRASSQSIFDANGICIYSQSVCKSANVPTYM